MAQGLLVSGGLAVSPVWAQAAEKKLRIGVLDHRDQWTKLSGTAAMFAGTGAEVVELGLNQAADEQNLDAIVLGSFSSESSAYVWYRRNHLASLLRFVEHGGVLLQMTQADQHEPTPPFLPDGVELFRGDTDPTSVIARRADHPLLKGLVDTSKTPGTLKLEPHLRKGGWEAFEAYKGFAAIAAGTEQGDQAVLLEARHGKGRIVVSALYFDRLFDKQEQLAAPRAFATQAKQFGQNIVNYAAMIRAGRAPAFQMDRAKGIIEPAAFTAGAWTLAVMPDTQVYSQSHPEHFVKQTQWILDQVGPLNIQHALHLGDIVNRGNKQPFQWDNAERALTRLIGKVPLGIIPGNHDYDDDKGAVRVTQLNRIISPKQLASGKTLVELYDKSKIDNQALAFEVNDQKWLMLGLEWGPRDPVLKWAKGILEKYSDHQSVVFTHAYMYSDETRHNHTNKSHKWNPIHRDIGGGSNDGEMIWQKLIRDASNVRMVTSGHVLNDGLGYLGSESAAGHTVHQILQNYQMKKEGGQGYLRLYEFLPDGKTVQAKTYSPSLDRFKTDPANQFTLTL